MQKSYEKISETSVIEHNWTVDSEIIDRSVLSDELVNFCAKYPIYNVKKMEDTRKPITIQTGGKKHIKTFKIQYNRISFPETLRFRLAMTSRF